MPSVQACLKTIEELKYEITLKDEALKTADSLISFLRQENLELKSQLDYRSIYAEVSLASSNKENEEILQNIDQSSIAKITSTVTSEREKMRNRFKKYLNPNINQSKYQSNRYSLNSTKLSDTRIRSRSIHPQSKQLQTIQDDLNQLKQRVQKKDKQIVEIVAKNQLMEDKYSKLLTMLKNKSTVY